MRDLREVVRYNDTQLSSGKMTPKHVAVAIRIAQRRLGLRVDGKAGPLTLTALNQYLSNESDPGLELLSAMQSELGNGELPEFPNNGGPHVARYFGRPFDAEKNYGNWCAALVRSRLTSIGYRVAHTNGAKRLLRNVVEAGGIWILQPRRFRSPVELMTIVPGDLIAWSHPDGSWRGHVAVVIRYVASRDTVEFIDGNRGPHPARVRYGELREGRWRKRLYGVARLTTSSQTI